MQPVTVDEVDKLVRKKLGSKLPADAVLDVDQTFEDIGLSSLQIADIVYSLEDRLNVRFDPADAADVHTIGDLIKFVNKSIRADHREELT